MSKILSSTSFPSSKALPPSSLSLSLTLHEMNLPHESLSFLASPLMPSSPLSPSLSFFPSSSPFSSPSPAGQQGYEHLAAEGAFHVPSLSSSSPSSSSSFGPYTSASYGPSSPSKPLSNSCSFTSSSSSSFSSFVPSVGFNEAEFLVPSSYSFNSNPSSPPSSPPSSNPSSEMLGSSFYPPSFSSPLNPTSTFNPSHSHFELLQAPQQPSFNHHFEAFPPSMVPSISPSFLEHLQSPPFSSHLSSYPQSSSSPQMGPPFPPSSISPPRPAQEEGDSSSSEDEEEAFQDEDDLLSSCPNASVLNFPPKRGGKHRKNSLSSSSSSSFLSSKEIPFPPPSPDTLADPIRLQNYRQERNRLAAKRSRERKKNYVRELEQACRAFKKHNDELAKELLKIKKELALLNASASPSSSSSSFPSSSSSSSSTSGPAAASPAVASQVPAVKASRKVQKKA